LGSFWSHSSSKSFDKEIGHHKDSGVVNVAQSWIEESSSGNKPVSPLGLLGDYAKSLFFGRWLLVLRHACILSLYIDYQESCRKSSVFLGLFLCTLSRGSGVDGLRIK
jgi:hypothetical protein